MSAESLLQLLTQILFVFIFLVVGVKALRHPRRATIDTALLFGATMLIVAEGLVAPRLGPGPRGVLTALVASLLMALPYLLLRLVDDFSTVPRWLLLAAELGLAAIVVSLFVLPAKSDPAWLILAYVGYFIALAFYGTGAFVREARGSSGVTRRRMQAVAAGSLFLGLSIIMDGLTAVLPHQAALWNALSSVGGLASGLGYFIGFAPPAWLRRAWQEPEVRAFLGRAARLPRLPTTGAIVEQLEHGAASSLGAPRASICLWDPEAGVLWAEVDGVRVEIRPGEMIAGRVFASQRPLFWDNAARHDPAHAERYRANNANALLAVPISAGEKRLGVLVVYAARPSIFVEDDLVLAQLLADQAAVILESRALIDEAARVHAREEAARLKDDFLSAAAHDLKTPLTAIIVQAQLLERRARNDPAAPPDLSGLQRLVGEAQRLKRLVLDLLDVSRVEQGRLVGKREPTDLTELARGVCARYSSAYHRCLLDAQGEIVGEYDQGRIEQLLDNLVDNAVKYSPNGGDVRVAVWREHGTAHLTVTDSGIGIPASDLPHLFDRFHRGANVDDRRFAGLGLGLFICQGIVAQHGGRLWASSPGVGKGSTFHVELPVTPVTDAARPIEARDAAAHDAALIAEGNAP